MATALPYTAPTTQLEQTELYKYLGTHGHELSLVSFEKGDFLARSDESLDEIFYVLKGKVEVQCITESGRRILVDEVPPGEFVGKISYMYEQNLHCDFLVTSPALLARIPAATFKALEENPQFMKFFFFKTSRRIYLIYKQLLAKSIFRLEENLAYYIVQNAQGGIFAFDSMYSLASRLTVSRKNLYNVINRFVKQGYVERKTSCLVVVNAGALEELSKGVQEIENIGGCALRFEI